MKVCRICRTENAPEHTHCTLCGAELGRIDDTTHELATQKQTVRPQFRHGNPLVEDTDLLNLVITHVGIAIPLYLKSGEKAVLGRRHKVVKEQKETDHPTVTKVSAEFRARLLELHQQTQQAKKEGTVVKPPPLIDLGLYDGKDKGVSRKHAFIERQDSILYISDSSSTNGTFINGALLVPYQKRLLRNGDTIRLGALSIEVRVHPKTQD